ncbi:MAG: hypothetical protein FJX72_21085, partial [Armatimonadetes bacterium]|nr:hypothetical protein [Armatimonadota bacterium]
MQKLELLVRTGGIAATLGDPPADSPDAGARDEAVVNASGRLFADGAEPSRRIGAGSALHAPSDVADLVGRIAARVPPHAVGVSRYLHRRIGDADTYLLVSRSTHDVTREVTLKHSGSAVAPASRAKPADVAPASRRQPVNVAPASRRQPSAWIADPWTGTVRRAQTRPAGPGRITVRVSFAASRAQFVVLSATPPVLTPSRSPLLSRPSSPDRAPVFAATGALRPPAERVGRPTEPQPIALEGEWRTALMPTLDNRFGDFAHPASAAPVAVECRRFRYREEADNEDGITNEWYVPDHADANWQPVTAGHGPHWWISRPDVGNRPLRMPGPDDGDWRPDPKVWEPAVFSLRTGIEKDPVYAQWLGPKGRVPDEYLDFGTAPPGTVRFAVTFVHVPTACEAAIRCGAGDARVAVNGRWLPAGSVVRARLPQGYNAIAAQFRHTGNAPLRTYVHIGPAESASRGPAWIWTGRTSDVSDCYARKVLHLDAKPDWASLSVTADNGYELYVNGRFIGRDVGAGTERWSVAERYSVAQ